ncbi:MAG: hypothetical protein M1519_01050 [Actinobacteria bacterium]|nr:hypothetical protein [Actinomycetota bacterium]
MAVEMEDGGADVVPSARSGVRRAGSSFRERSAVSYRPAIRRADTGNPLQEIHLGIHNTCERDGSPGAADASEYNGLVSAGGLAVISHSPTCVEAGAGQPKEFSIGNWPSRVRTRHYPPDERRSTRVTSRGDCWLS